MASIWQKTASFPSFQPLQHDIRTDVLVIGGGIAGLLCAYRLQRVGVDCVLVEADRLCRGMTGNTTAKITAQHGLIYHKIAKRYGLESARLYLEANQQAVEQYRDLCRRIDCDYEHKPNYVYSLDDRQRIDRELEVLEQIGAAAEYAQDLPLPFPVAGAVYFPEQAQFHPLKFLTEIARGLRIYESTKVQELLPRQALTNRGSITAEKIIVATHFPFLNKHGAYFLKMYQHRSYVLALAQAAQVDGMYLDDDGKGLSFRHQGALLLLGGGSHRTGKQGGNWNELTQVAKQFYPHSCEVARWAAQDCMTLDGIPYIGQYARSTPDLYVATGFNKWGMTSAMVAANLLTDLVQGKENPYATVFSPSRTMLHPQLLCNVGEAVLSMVTPTKPRCPHMGCALKYNRQEHSWDCTCHGSRFTADGELIDNPATDDMKH